MSLVRCRAISALLRERCGAQGTCLLRGRGRHGGVRVGSPCAATCLEDGSFSRGPTLPWGAASEQLKNRLFSAAQSGNRLNGGRRAFSRAVRITACHARAHAHTHAHAHAHAHMQRACACRTPSKVVSGARFLINIEICRFDPQSAPEALERC